MRQGGLRVMTVAVRRWRQLALALALALAGGLPAAPAQAWDVAIAGTEIRFDAAPGETNQVTVERDPTQDTIRFSDERATRTGPATGCTVDDDGAVACPAYGLVSLAVQLGDGPDELSLADASLTTRADGGSGDDQVIGLGAAETLVGGDGDDSLDSGAGADAVDGGAGDDVILGGDGGDVLSGGDGGDQLDGAAGDDALDGGAGDDALDGGAGDDSVSDPAGDDALAGDEGIDRLQAGSGADALDGGDGTDLLDGGDGDDDLDGGIGADQVDGGPGTDRLTAVAGPDRLVGGDGDDTVEGSPEADELVGGPGADVLEGGAGDDRLLSEAGADRLNGGEGGDRLEGGGDADHLEGGPEADSLSGGDGFDLASYEAATASVRVTVDDVAGDGEDGEGDDVRRDVESILGGTFDDALVASEAGGELLGGDGADVLVGGAAADRLDGGDGDDGLDGGLGPDRLVGGDGTDTVTYASRTRALTVTVGDPRPDGQAGEGDDVDVTVDRVVAGPRNDTLGAGPGAAVSFAGGAGDDIITLTDLDGTTDAVDCGPGRDRAVVDGFDSFTADCEDVLRDGKRVRAPFLLVPSLEISSRALRVGRSRRTSVLVRCARRTSGGCSGRLTVSLRGDLKLRTAGSARYRLRAGQSRRVRVRIDPRPFRSLKRRRGRSLAASVRATVVDRGGRRGAERRLIRAAYRP